MPIKQADSEALPGQPDEAFPGKKHGRLKIYLGYAAGVGKTFTMLKDAHGIKKDGIDIIAGYIEPHSRPETMALSNELEILPTLQISYKGVTFREFDLDRALERKPDIILVDELAHTNAEGCRHKKRYQDIDELLRAGIDVFTTINIQHIESLNDIVASITGISVRETIPDNVFDSADKIELIDIEPDDLIDRLQRGKIYHKEQAKRALVNFFKKNNLIALREIALRRTADQVNRTAIQNSGPLKDSSTYVREHILVCLSSAPSNAKVIRTAARMSSAFHGIFTALFVETSGTQKSGNKNKAALRKNTRLAEQLGAQIATVYGDDIPAHIAEYAKAGRVSKIVMGRSGHLQKWLRKTNYVDRLTSLAPALDIYIIPDTQSSFRIKYPGIAMSMKISFIDSAKSAAVLIFCTLIGLWFEYLGFSNANIITIYILGVLINAMITKGRIYSVLSSVFCVLIFDFLFTEPVFSFQAYSSGYPVTFMVMLSAAFITGTLTKRVKNQARQAAQKAYRTEVLLETSRKLQQARDETDILRETALQMLKLLDRTVIFYSVQGNILSKPFVFQKDDSSDNPQVYFGADERAAAEWVYKNNKKAGATTDTFTAAKCLYFAVHGDDTVLAVVGIAMDSKFPLEPYENNLMIAMLGECAMVLEKERLNEKQKQISMRIQQEQLRANLLRTISHDLRTPLTSISGNAGILMRNSAVLAERQKKALYTDIYDDSAWLIKLVENMLSITRIDNDMLNLNMQPELLEEVIAEALLHVSRNSAEHNIKMILDDELLMAKMDYRLIIQVLINIIDNAIKYTPAGSHIFISARHEKETAVIEVADDGPGIPDKDKINLFDMFYTAGNIRGDGRRGLGLGLYLCKSIVEAHKGEIFVKNNIPQGTIFGFTLQVEEVDMHE
ncbi:sensor histidine kinase [Pectinatus haikarae]|uniref:sensor histidine kinase n=1 Tax=Pectinatus haikarae TaxID=349096 RepID=UPI0018C6CBA6|nr:sensor histidine kinase KdpD [Pectinatus haikarae]